MQPLREIEAGFGGSGHEVLDLRHLGAQTAGDTSLARELLDLFNLQARSILGRLRIADRGALRADLAHMLKGSALAVGAWEVAEAAEICESLGNSDPEGWGEAVLALAEAVHATEAAIMRLRDRL